MTGDGTTSNVLLIGELLKQSEKYILDGLHPRSLTEGINLAKAESLKFLDQFRLVKDNHDRETLLSVAKSALLTKLPFNLVNDLASVLVEGVLSIYQQGQPIDLHMIEIMKMQTQHANNTCLIKGLVLDHGGRHPEMPKKLSNCYILNLNVSLEYEKTEINSGFYYSSAKHRDQLVQSERSNTDSKIKKIIELKNLVCDEPTKSFVIINQKGIDPLSLDMLAKQGILALRRAKRRNAERVQLICGAVAQNSVDDLSPDILGFAGSVYEISNGEDKFTFIENVKSPKSVTILIKGPNSYTINMINDSVRDGLRAVKNAIEDKCVVPGGGAFYVALHRHLTKLKPSAKPQHRNGIQAFADSLLIIPKTLAINSGYNHQDFIGLVFEDHEQGRPFCLDINTGKTLDPVANGIFDNYRVLRHLINSCTVIACNLLLVDEILRAGRSSLKNES